MRCVFSGDTSCEICGGLFMQLVYHMKISHITCNEQKCNFGDCEKGFVDMDHLKNHNMNVHIKRKPYQCRYCYNDISNKSAHERCGYGQLFNCNLKKIY